MTLVILVNAGLVSAYMINTDGDSTYETDVGGLDTFMGADDLKNSGDPKELIWANSFFSGDPFTTIDSKVDDKDTGWMWYAAQGSVVNDIIAYDLITDGDIFTSSLAIFQ